MIRWQKVEETKEQAKSKKAPIIKIVKKVKKPITCPPGQLQGTVKEIPQKKEKTVIVDIEKDVGATKCLVTRTSIRKTIKKGDTVCVLKTMEGYVITKLISASP